MAAMTALAGPLLLFWGCNDTLNVAAANQPPTRVELTASTISGNAPLDVTFSGDATDGDGTIVSLELDPGDGSAPLDGADTSHTYTVTGSYDATLIATDDRGAVGVDTVRITVGNPPTVTSYATDVHPLWVNCTGCHPSSGGLSLTGSPAQTYPTVRSLVNTTNPGSSAILTEANGVSHGGGTIWSVSDPEYQTVLSWIQEGALNN